MMVLENMELQNEDVNVTAARRTVIVHFLRRENWKGSSYGISSGFDSGVCGEDEVVDDDADDDDTGRRSSPCLPLSRSSGSELFSLDILCSGTRTTGCLSFARRMVMGNVPVALCIVYAAEYVYRVRIYCMDNFQDFPTFGIPTADPPCSLHNFGAISVVKASDFTSGSQLYVLVEPRRQNKLFISWLSHGNKSLWQR